MFPAYLFGLTKSGFWIKRLAGSVTVEPQLLELFVGVQIPARQPNSVNAEFGIGEASMIRPSGRIIAAEMPL